MFNATGYEDDQSQGRGNRMPAKIGHRSAGVAATLMIALLAILPYGAMAASAQPEPEVLVAQVYHHLIAAERSSKGYSPPETFYTPRLKALVAASRRKAAGEEPCGLDFVFWVNGQDEQIRNLTVTRGPATAPDRTTVTATFQNLGEPEKIVFDFQKLGGRWLLDDAHSIAGDTRWTFSRQLQCKD
jgi:hypothetical protein